MKSDWVFTGFFQGLAILTRQNLEIRLPAGVVPASLRLGDVVELTAWGKADARATPCYLGRCKEMQSG